MAAALESTAMDEEVGARATTVTASTGGLTAVSSSTTLAPAAIVQQAAAEALEAVEQSRRCRGMESEWTSVLAATLGPLTQISPTRSSGSASNVSGLAITSV